MLNCLVYLTITLFLVAAYGLFRHIKGQVKANADENIAHSFKSSDWLIDEYHRIYNEKPDDQMLQLKVWREEMERNVAARADLSKRSSSDVNVAYLSDYKASRVNPVASKLS